MGDCRPYRLSGTKINRIKDTMNFYSQIKQYVPPTEPEHILRKCDLDAVISGFYSPAQHRQRVAVGGLISKDENGRAVVQLLNALGIPAGRIVRNVILLPVQNTPVQTVLDNKELIARARKDNPLNETVII